MIGLTIAVCQTFSGGCGESGQTDGNLGDAGEVIGERPWIEQVRAVREGRTQQIIVEQQTITPLDWKELAEGCETLEVLEVSDCDDFASFDLELLETLPQLSRLKLGAPIDDAGMQRIAVAASLRALNLPAGRFTDSGLSYISMLPHLELLRFQSPHVTDAGLESVARMKSLRFLHLLNVPVTDTGLASLHRMTWLESFYLDGGGCTDEGLSELLTALPELHFHKDQLHLPGDPHAHTHQ